MYLFCIFSCNLLSKKRVIHYILNFIYFMIKSIGRLACAAFLLVSTNIKAQVNAVEYGKNRVQYQKFNWKYYQTENFNTYFSQDGLDLGKYVAQVAEKELPQLEEFVEYGLQR